MKSNAAGLVNSDRTVPQLTIASLGYDIAPTLLQRPDVPPWLSSWTDWPTSMPQSPFLLYGDFATYLLQTMVYSLDPDARLTNVLSNPLFLEFNGFLHY